ncbi:phosphatase PAP2 family protein [Streptomyces lavendulocolor]|uniref:phosphatase PAP2 family protein n=1 Tax=Streptomyces lavendulocolor TaxID=67316 RepID=UPI0033E93725
MVKPVVGRPRPQLAGRLPLVPAVGRNGFPSSHAASAAAAVVAFSALLPRLPMAVAATAMARLPGGRRSSLPHRCGRLAPPWTPLSRAWAGAGCGAGTGP